MILKPTTKGLPNVVKTDYLTDPKLMLAMEMQKSASSTAPVGSPFEALARVVQGGVSGYQQENLRNEYKQAGADYNKALAEAMASPDPMAALKASQNEYVQSMAQELMGKDLENRSKMDIELEGKRKEYQDPIIMGGKERLARAGHAVTNVNMNQEKEEDKAVGKAMGENYVKLQEAGLAAPGKIAKYERLNTLLDGVDTGKFKGTTTEIKAAAKGVGIDLESLGIADDVAPIQAATALVNAMALEARNPSGGAGMPGALSDADRDYLVAMQPGIEKTPEGRRLLSETNVKIAKRDQEVAQLARNYRRKNGKLDEGFYDVLADYSEKNPLFKEQTTQTPKAPAGNGSAKFLGYE